MSAEYYTVEHYRGKFGDDLTLQHKSEGAAREYLRHLAAIWRSEGVLVSCAATECEPARITGQAFTAQGVPYVTRKAWLLRATGDKTTVVQP